MKRTLFHPLFIIIILLSGSNKLIELSGIYIPLVHAYMDDLFCIPFVLTPTLYLMRRFIFNNGNYTLGKLQIAAAVVYCTVLFELILPQLSLKYTADVLDVVCYILGAILFHYFINRNQLMPSVSRAERNISSASSLV
jgi:hypothetical protein